MSGSGLSVFRLVGNVSVQNGVGVAELATVGLPASTIRTGRFTSDRLPLDPVIVGHLTPASNVTYDLGSATHRWKDLYLSGNTIVLGNTFIREGLNESVQLGGESTTVNAEAFSGNGALLTSLDASQLTSGVVPNARISGAYSGFTTLETSGDLTVGGNLYVLTGNVVEIQTETQITDQLVVTNAGTGPALIVEQTGAQDIADFKDDGNVVVRIHDGGAVSIGGDVAVPLGALHVQGNVYVAASGMYVGNGAGLTALNASAVTTGTLDNARISGATTSAAGVVQLTDSATTTSSTLAATATAVKAANDNANTRVLKSGDTMTGNLNLPNAGKLTFGSIYGNEILGQVGPEYDTHYFKVYCRGVLVMDIQRVYNGVGYTYFSQPLLLPDGGTITFGNGNHYIQRDAGNSIVIRNSTNATVLYYPLNGTGWVYSSDRRLKRDISSLDEGYMDRILRLDPVSFRFNNDANDSPLKIGFIAQDVQEIFPSVVDEHSPQSGENGTPLLGIQMTGFIPYLVKAFQEHAAATQELDRQLQAAKAETESLRAETESLRTTLESVLARLAALEAS